MGYALDGEPLLEALAHGLAAEEREPCGPRRPPASMSSTMKPLTPSSITSGTEPRRQATTGVPQAIASIWTRPKGSGQSIGNSNAEAPPRKACFSLSLTSPIYSTPRTLDERADRLVKIGLVDLVDLGGDLELDAGAPGDLDRPVRALFRADPAEERQISALACRRKRIEIFGETMQHRRDPVRRAEAFSDRQRWKPAASRGIRRAACGRREGRAGHAGWSPRAIPDCERAGSER